MSGDAVCMRANEETSFQLCDEKRYVVYGTYSLSSVAMKAAESREKSSATSNPAPHEHGEESSTKIGVIVRDGIRLMLGCFSVVVVSSSDGLQDCFEQAGVWLFGGHCFYLRIGTEQFRYHLFNGYWYAYAHRAGLRKRRMVTLGAEGESEKFTELGKSGME